MRVKGERTRKIKSKRKSANEEAIERRETHRRKIPHKPVIYLVIWAGNKIYALKTHLRDLFWCSFSCRGPLTNGTT